MTRLACLLLVCASCADVPQPFDLDHARVIAIRLEPPAIAAGGVATIDVLFTDSSIDPRVADPSAIEVTVAQPELAGLVSRTERGWQVTAPDAATLDAARSALGLAAAAPIVVPLALTVATLDTPLVAQKTIVLGATAANPSPPEIVLDGAPGALAMRVGQESMLGVAAPDDALTYRWFSSVGELVGYTRPEARIDPDASVTRGTVIVVVRDPQGGTAWTIAPASVAAP